MIARRNYSGACSNLHEKTIRFRFRSVAKFPLKIRRFRFSANGICPRYFLHDLSVPFPLHLLFSTAFCPVCEWSRAHYHRECLYLSDPRQRCVRANHTRTVARPRNTISLIYPTHVHSIRVDTARVLFTERLRKREEDEQAKTERGTAR